MEFLSNLKKILRGSFIHSFYEFLKMKLKIAEKSKSKLLHLGALTVLIRLFESRFPSSIQDVLELQICVIALSCVRLLTKISKFSNLINPKFSNFIWSALALGLRL